MHCIVMHLPHCSALKVCSSHLHVPNCNTIYVFFYELLGSKLDFV